MFPALRAPAVLVAALVALLAAAAPASATTAPPPPASAAYGGVSLVVWSGGLTPASGSRGVLVRDDGTARRLRVAPGSTAVQDVGPLVASAARRAQIRAAAIGALSAPAYTARPGVDGPYVTAVIQRGGQRAALIAVGDAPARLGALLTALNAALPASGKLEAPSVRRGPFATAAVFPTTADCPPGSPEQATTTTKELNLKDAAKTGVARLSSKGGFDGDSIRVDGTWKRVRAPIKVTINVEYQNPPGRNTWAQFKSLVDRRLAGHRVVGGPDSGMPINFVLNGRPRPASGPTPCFHQIKFLDDPNLRGGGSNAGPEPGGYEISARDPGSFAHEAAHMAGLPDKYSDVFVVGNRRYPLPEVGLEGQALANALRAHGVSPSAGHIEARVHPGARTDLMGGSQTTGRIGARDLRDFAANAAIVLTDPGGTRLLNKNPGAQNMVTGGDPNGRPFRLFVPKGGTARADGLYAYCIDLSRHVPARDEGFDVLGPLSAEPDPASQALARVMNVIAARRARLEPPARLIGAQAAIWRVTDNSETTFGEASEILAEAGVPPTGDLGYVSPPNPNAGSPATGAVSGGAVEPPAPEIPEPPAPRSSLSRLAVSARPTVAVPLAGFRVVLTGAEGRVVFTLMRLGPGRRTTRPLGARNLDVGENLVALRLPRLRTGRYQLVARSAAGTVRRVSFTVVRR